MSVDKETPCPRDAPCITFIIPVRNDARRLGVCLASIHASGCPASNMEIIVADNGSVDDSVKIAENAGARVLSLPSLTVASLRNRAAGSAHGRILAFIDSDHELGPGWSDAALAALADPAVSAVGAAYLAPRPGTWVQRMYQCQRRPGVRPQVAEWLASGNLAIKREAFDAVGGFDPSLTACEDVDLCQRLRQRGHRLLNDPRLVSVHHGDPKSLVELFRSELWRGRNNLRVSLRGSLKIRDLPSILIPILDLCALVGVLLVLVFAPTRALEALTYAAILFLGFVALRAVRMLRPLAARGLALLPAALFFLSVYDLARALALVWPSGHKRSGTKPSSSVPLPEQARSR